MSNTINAMRFGTYLVERGYISAEEGQEVLDKQESIEKPIRERFGRIAIENGFASEREVERAFLLKCKEEILGAV